MESIWKRDCVHLGRQGENAARPIQVYLTAWLDDYPTATIELLILRPGEDTPIKQPIKEFAIQPSINNNTGGF